MCSPNVLRWVAQQSTCIHYINIYQLGMQMWNVIHIMVEALRPWEFLQVGRLWMSQSCGNILLKWLPSRWMLRFQLTKMNDFGCGYFYGPKGGRPIFVPLLAIKQPNEARKPTEDMFLLPLSTNIYNCSGYQHCYQLVCQLSLYRQYWCFNKERVWLEVSKQTLHCCSIVPGSTHDLQVMNHVRFCIESLIPPFEESSLQLQIYRKLFKCLSSFIYIRIIYYGYMLLNVIDGYCPISTCWREENTLKPYISGVLKHNPSPNHDLSIYMLLFKSTACIYI